MRLLAALLVLALFAACKGSSPDDGDVRFLHASANTDSLDVVIGNRVVFDALVFGDVTGYEKVQAEEQDVSVRSSQDRSDAPLRFVANLVPNTPQTIIAAGVRRLIRPIVLRDSLFTGSSAAHVRIVHAVALADSVDVTFAPAASLPALPTFTSVKFRQNTGYLDLAPGTYRLQVSPTGGGGLLLNQDVVVAAGPAHTLVLTDASATGGVALIQADDMPPATVR